MEKIKNIPIMERPREKVLYQGVQALSDEELLAILLGSGTPKYPLNRICAALGQHELSAIAQMDMKALCEFNGIGPAKATTLLAVTEFCRRSKSLWLKDGQACYEYLLPLLAQATQLQYILLLISAGRELLAFSEAGSVLPDISWITELAIQAGAGRILLGRNGWPAFSNTESRYLTQLQVACAALGIICEGFMAIGPERFKMIEMNIGEIIGEYVYLKQLGEGFVGRCPFCLHPQQCMVVIPSLKTYECLHCRQTGGAIHFVKRIENIIKWDFRRSARRIVKHTIGTVYVLKLENNCYYIGFTQNLPHRVTQHFVHKGALWTRKHQPLKLEDVYYDVPEFVEHRVTKRYIELYGPEKVRGGNYVDARDQPGEYHRYPKRFSHKRRPHAIS